MNVLYRTLTALLVLSLVLVNTGYANGLEDTESTSSSLPLISKILESTPVDKLQVNQQVQVGNYQMQITELNEVIGHDASGNGRLYVPFLSDTINVQFKHISVNLWGDLIKGEISAVVADLDQPTYISPESEVLKYLQLAENRNNFPLSLNSKMEARGIDFGDHDMVITNLVLNNENTFYDLLYLVHNPDGKVNTFSQKSIPLENGDITFCDTQLSIDGGDQPYNDLQFPFRIKGFNKGASGTAEGTYVEFGCTGLVSFQLVGEYEFYPEETDVILDELYPIEGGGQQPEATNVIATFSASMETWGQFYADVTFNGSFTIVGGDDVVIVINNGVIDYDENQSPLDVEVGWRGFYIETLGVHLPESISFDSGEDTKERIEIEATDLFYDHASGLSVTVSVTEDPHILKGSLEGWSFAVNSISMEIVNNSFSAGGLVVGGWMQIPVTGENDQIDYVATFSESGVNFELSVAGEYELPFLEESTLNLNGTSVVGINNEGIYANLSGTINVQVGDFNFDGLGFSGFEIPTTGIQDLSIYAFSFGEFDFVVGDLNLPPGGNGENPASNNVPDENTQGEKVKGFPISISDISFGDGGYAKSGIEDEVFEEQDLSPAELEAAYKLKKLGFTIKVNFTNPKIGVNAAGTFDVYGRIDPVKLFPFPIDDYAPWEAFDMHTFELNKLLVDMDMGGIKLEGGVLGIDDHDVYGKGFKGALTLTVEPNVQVQAIALFGKTDHNSNEEYRYWFADAKMLLKTGIALPGGVIGLNGFGGGAYYNMEQKNLIESLPIVAGTPEEQVPDEEIPTTQVENLMNNIGLSLSGTEYEPKKPPGGEIIGVKATVVLATLSNSDIANMDLTLDISFTIDEDEFGLNTVSFSGAAYFMAPITERDKAKVTATANILYHHKEKYLDGLLTADIKADPLTGDGKVLLHVNLKDGEEDDWYIAIGTPPLGEGSRINLGIKVDDIEAAKMNGYFVAGNVDKLPSDRRDVPELWEYHSSLSTFQSEVEPIVLSEAQRSYSILMGAQYELGPIEEEWWIFKANAHATAGFDLKLDSGMTCPDSEEYKNGIGIDGWYLTGQAYAALSGGVDVHVDLFFVDDWFNIFELEAAALLQVALPNPSWMKANIKGEYSILDGLVEGKFEAEFEVGEKCDLQSTPIDPAALAANIQIIDEVKPDNSDGNVVAANREIIAVITCSTPINSVLDFSDISDEGLQLKPVLTNNGAPVISNNPAGEWRYLDSSGNPVGTSAEFVTMEFVSTALLEQTLYTVNVATEWLQRVKREDGTYSDDDWKPVIKKDDEVAGDIRYGKFRGSEKPDFLTDKDLLAAWPNTGARNHFIHENPAGGGLALKLNGWGHLFNPVRKVEGTDYQYDFYLRVRDLSVPTGSQDKDGNAVYEIIFQEPLKAIPISPAWGETVKQIIDFEDDDCGEGGVLEIITDALGTKCYKPIYGEFTSQPGTEGAYGVGTPGPWTNGKTSNIANASYAWDFGGITHSDLAVYKAISLNTSTTNNMAAKRNIGFPDFSDVLQPSKVYQIEIVGIPQLDEGYTVNTSTDIVAGQAKDESGNLVVNTPSGQEYTVEEVTASIEGSFDGVPEKPIYAYRFATSAYPNFIAKISNSEIKDISFGKEGVGGYYSPYFKGNRDITFFDDFNESTRGHLYNQTEGFDRHEIRRILFSSEVSFNSSLWNSYQNSAPVYAVPVLIDDDGNPLSSPRKMLFHKKPMGTQFQFQNENFTTGIKEPLAENIYGESLVFFPRWLELNKKWKTFSDALLPGLYSGNYPMYVKPITGHWSEKLYFLTHFNPVPATNVAYVSQGSSHWTFQTLGNNTYYMKGYGNSNFFMGRSWEIRGLDLAGTYGIYVPGTYNDSYPDMLQSNGEDAHVSIGYDVVSYYNQFRWSILPVGNPDPVRQYNSSDYFKIKYDKKQAGLGAIEISWDGPANSNSTTTSSGEISTADYSGEYYIRNVGSGRYLRYQMDGGKIISTEGEQKSDDQYLSFTLIKQYFGEYLIKCHRGDGKKRYIGKEEDLPNNLMGGRKEKNSITVKPELQEDGTFKLRLTNNDLLHEDPFGKSLHYGSASDYNDYDKFTLVKNWEAPPTDLNKTQLIQCVASRHFLNNDAGGTIKSETTGTTFKLMRRGDGSYNISAGENKLCAVNQGDHWVYTTAPQGNLSDRHYRFTLEKTGFKYYHIKSKESDEYLYELFDLNFGVQHQHILSATTPFDDKYSKFQLLDPEVVQSPSYVEYPNYSGEYLIQVEGSGRYLYDDGEIISTKIQEDNNAIRFVLKQVSVGSYEIWNKSSMRTMRFDDSGNATTKDPGNQNSNYAFSIGQYDNGSYHISIYYKKLQETFDLYFGPGHGNIRRQENSTQNMNIIVEGEDYARFKLKEVDSYLTDDLSGEYLIQTKASAHFLQASIGNQNKASFSTWQPFLSRFVLKKRKGAYYEIWNRANGGRLHPVPGGYSFEGTAENTDDYLFDFVLQPDDSYQIKSIGNNNEFMHEYLDPNGPLDKQLRSQSVISEPHDFNFVLDSETEDTHDLSGTYYIKSKTTNKYWQDTDPSNAVDSSPFSTTASLSAERIIFTLEKQDDWNYKLIDPWGKEFNFYSEEGSYEESNYISIYDNGDGTVMFMLNSIETFIAEKENEVGNLPYGGEINNSFNLIPTETGQGAGQ